MTAAGVKTDHRIFPSEIEVDGSIQNATLDSEPIFNAYRQLDSPRHVPFPPMPALAVKQQSAEFVATIARRQPQDDKRSHGGQLVHAQGKLDLTVKVSREQAEIRRDQSSANIGEHEALPTARRLGSYEFGHVIAPLVGHTVRLDRRCGFQIFRAQTREEKFSIAGIVAGKSGQQRAVAGLGKPATRNG